MEFILSLRKQYPQFAQTSRCGVGRGGGGAEQWLKWRAAAAAAAARACALSMRAGGCRGAPGRPERGVRCTLGEACRTPPCLGTCAHLHAGRGLLNPSLPLRLCREGFYMQQDAEECWGAILISLRDKLKVRHQTAATPLLAPLAAAPAARGMAL